MIYFTAHTFNCVCHCIRAMFRVLGMYNFGSNMKYEWQISNIANSSVHKLYRIDIEFYKKSLHNPGV